MFIIRKIIGSVILFFNWVFTPKSIKRSFELQSKIDEKTAKLKLYQFHACPFCVKVRRFMKKHSLNIEIRDAKSNETFRQELKTHGGKVKVPCLRIEDDKGKYLWMYESSDINKYLEKIYS